MDPFQRMSASETIAEMRNLASGVDFALTLDELRPLFYRADTLSKQHPDNEEVQSLLADIKRKIASQGTAIKQGTAQRPAVQEPAPPPPPVFDPPPAPAEPPAFAFPPPPPQAAPPPAPPALPDYPSFPPPPPAAAPPPMPPPLPPPPPAAAAPPPIPPPGPASGGTLITPVSPDSIPTAGFDIGAFQFPKNPAAVPPPPPPLPPAGAGGPATQQPFAAPPPPPPGFGGPPTQSPFGGPPTQQPFGGPPTQQPFGGAPTQQPFGAQRTQPPFPGAPPQRTQQMPPGVPSTRTPTPQRPMAAQAGAPAKKRSLLPLFVLGGIIWIAAMAGGLYWYFVMRAPATPGMFAMEFITNPPGADVRINHELKGKSNLNLELPPGEYKLEVVLDGYEPAVSSFTAGDGQPVQVSLNLTPRPQTVRFYTDLTEGTVSLDGQPAGELQDGQLVLESVPPGAHTVQVSGGKSEVSFSFELTPGRAPTLTSPITAKEVLAVVVSNAGRQAFARSSAVPMKVGLDGQPAGEIGQDGLMLDNIFAGDHELSLGDGANSRKIVVNFGPSPALTAFLKLDLNAGTLVVVTGEDDAAITLNGKPYRARTRRGMIRIPNLAVTDYVVAVRKDGFEQPGDQVAKVRKGEETRLEFKLRPVQRFAALRVRGAPQGTSVLLDGNAVGQVGGDGTFSLANIQPGDHVVELRRDRHQPKRFTKPFPAGVTVEIAEDVALEKMPGMLRLQLAPADSRVVLRPAGQRGGAGERVIREQTVTVPEGSWTLSATAPNYSEKTATVQVAAGETVTVDLRLSRPTVTAKQIKPIGMEGWEQPGQWAQDGSWQVRQGGNYVLFGHQPLNGVFTFTSAILKGGRLRWVVNYADSRNHVLMEMDSDDYWRKIVTNGRQRELFKAKHGVDKRQGYWTLSIDLIANTMVHKIFRNGAWTVLDTWTVNDQDFTAGKFGFYIPGSDRVGVSNFSFTPRQ